MVKVLQVSTECYPAAKDGGMGDVVGSLPIYFKKEKIEASVIIPKYSLKWFYENNFETVYQGEFDMGGEHIWFAIQKLEKGVLPYPFYCIHIPGKFDRDSVYLDRDGEGFRDEGRRNISFQRAVLIWLNSMEKTFDLVHCHDHQTGLIPFFMKKGIEFERLRNIPTYFTIHNSAYQGIMPSSYKELLPTFYQQDYGLLDWSYTINSVASAIKCCWRLSTVSPSYLREIQYTLPRLNTLLQQEASKSKGILNGIDAELWDPKKDKLIKHNFKKTWFDFKSKNKAYICKELGINSELPIFTFIGRLAPQKGADLIPEAIEKFYHHGGSANFIILGSGNKSIEYSLRHVESRYSQTVKTFIMYNEQLAHQLYASSDFLMMPSRFEPCGLNQMFSMRYGTIPLVRSTGGLKDTVWDNIYEGTGFQFEYAHANDLAHTLFRANELYQHPELYTQMVLRCVSQDFSWERSIKIYAKEYNNLIGMNQ